MLSMQSSEIDHVASRAIMLAYMYGSKFGKYLPS